MSKRIRSCTKAFGLNISPKKGKNSKKRRGSKKERGELMWKNDVH